jgi:hypothetical protein
MCLFIMVETRVFKKPHSSMDSDSSSGKEGGMKSIEMTVSSSEDKAHHHRHDANGSRPNQQFSILAAEEDEDEAEKEEVERPNLPERLARMVNLNHNKPQSMDRSSGRTYSQLALLTSEETQQLNSNDGEETTTDDEASVDSTGMSSPLHHTFRERLGNKDHSFASIGTDNDLSSLDDFDLEAGAGGDVNSHHNAKKGQQNNDQTDTEEEIEELCCVNTGTGGGWCMCLSTPNAVSTQHSPTAIDRNSSVNVLRQRNVILVTANYGILAMAYILLEETIPLFLKLDAHLGGFSFNSIQIGVLLSISGCVMFGFTLVFLPMVAKQSKKWMLDFGCFWAIPLAFSWPLLALFSTHVLVHIKSDFVRASILWPLLVAVSVAKSVMGCISFTAVMLQVNHSVHDEHLGAFI